MSQYTANSYIIS